MKEEKRESKAAASRGRSQRSVVTRVVGWAGQSKRWLVEWLKRRQSGEVAVSATDAQLEVVEAGTVPRPKLAKNRASFPWQGFFTGVDGWRSGAEDAVGRRFFSFRHHARVDIPLRLPHPPGRNDPVLQEIRNRVPALGSQSVFDLAMAGRRRSDDEVMRRVTRAHSAGEELGREEMKMAADREDLSLRVKVVGGRCIVGADDES